MGDWKLLYKGKSSCVSYRLLLILILLFSFSAHAKSAPVVIAHRGNSSVAPENTLSAIYAANYCGWGAEIDALKTQDGQYILMHDGTVDRTTDGTGRVDSLSFDYIRTLDASYTFPAYSPEQVPTLLEAVEAAMTCNLKLCIEIKAGTPSDLIPLLSPFSSYIELHSFSWSTLQSIANLGGDFTYVAIGNGDLDAIIPTLPTCIDKVSWDHGKITQSGIDTLHSSNKPIYAWTVNTTARALELAAMGVDGIISNYPATMLNLFSSSYTLGDANGDGTVDEIDAAALAENWQNGTGGKLNAWGMGDFNRDGMVDDRDATLLAANWGSRSAPSPNSVPEPSVFALIFASAIAFGAAILPRKIGYCKRIRRVLHSS